MGISTKPMMGIAVSVILVILGLAFGEEVITSAQTTLDNASIGNFIGLSTIAKIIPTFYYLGVMGLAAGIGYYSAKDAIGGGKKR